jgi:hypothetical protein
MAKKCTCHSIDPNQSVCCRAAAAGYANRPFPLPTSRGTRCFQCDIITRTNGKRGFRAHFVSGAQCGIGAGGCEALGNAAMGAGQRTLQGPTAGSLALPF